MVLLQRGLWELFVQLEAASFTCSKSRGKFNFMLHLKRGERNTLNVSNVRSSSSASVIAVPKRASPFSKNIVVLKLTHNRIRCSDFLPSPSSNPSLPFTSSLTPPSFSSSLSYSYLHSFSSSFAPPLYTPSLPLPPPFHL